jgi:hypothetical protein
MTPLITTIPDEFTALAAWLEDVLVDGNMPQLAAELQTVHGPDAGARQLDLDRELPLEAVYRRGLAALSEDNLRALLVRPTALLGLSERVFAQGGRYWTDRFKRRPGMAERTAASLQRLRRESRQHEPQPPLALIAPPVRRARWYRSPWLVAPLTAVAVLAAVVYLPQVRQQLLPLQPGPETAARWGWLKADALPTDVKPADYLDRIADLNDEWDKQRPETAEALAQRISEWRLGCARLQLQEHRPLDPKEKEWLLEKCRKWAHDIDARLADLESTRDVNRVRQEIATKVRKTSETLREEAERLRKGQA